MGKNENHALERGRERFQAGAPFTPKDTEALLAAGLDPGFDPAANHVDGKIEKFLTGVWGFPWREKLRPKPEPYTRDEARAIAAAAAEVEAKRLLWDQARDAWLAADAAQRAMGHRDAGTLTAMSRDQMGAVRLAALDQAVRDAEKRFAEARDELEAATARLNNLKLAAQERRRDELLRAGT